jgi:hypothetical protein
MDENKKLPWSFLLCLVFMMACGLTSCAGFRERIGMGETPGEAGAETPWEMPLPTIIAIMPFENKTGEEGAEERVRKEFYNLFSSKPYVDIEPSVIDEKIVILERETGKSVFDLKPSQVCQAIGCDGLIFGNVTGYEKIYAGVYSRLSAVISFSR